MPQPIDPVSTDREWCSSLIEITTRVYDSDTCLLVAKQFHTIAEGDEQMTKRENDYPAVPLTNASASVDLFLISIWSLYMLISIPHLLITSRCTLPSHVDGNSYI